MNTRTLSDLKIILQRITPYHGAKADFVKRFSLKIDRNLDNLLPRKTYHDIIQGKITFERDKWANYLPIAFQAAEETLIYFEKKQAKQVQTINPSSFFDFSKAIKYIESCVDRSDYLFSRGDMKTSLNEIQSLNEFVQLEQIKTNNPYLYGYFYLIFAKLQMQFGISDGEEGSFILAQKSFNIFKNLEKERGRLIQVIDLKGHIYRQIGNYDEALVTFSQAANLTNHLHLPAERKNSYMYIQHQIALTLMKKGLENNDSCFLNQSKKIFHTSNSFYENSNNESWYNFSRIREAELHVKSNNIIAAEQILDYFEDPCEISLMTKARIAIFHRINAERYIKANDSKNALRYFKAAVKLSFDEKYTHELKQLEKLYFDNRVLNQNLSENFSIENPIWN